VSRGALGEAVGRLGEEKVGVTAGIVTHMIRPIIYLVFRLVLLYALTSFIIHALWYCSTLDSIFKM